MSTFLIVISIVTVYLARAAAAARKLIRTLTRKEHS